MAAQPISARPRMHTLAVRLQTLALSPLPLRSVILLEPGGNVLGLVQHLALVFHSVCALRSSLQFTTALWVSGAAQ